MNEENKLKERVEELERASALRQKEIDTKLKALQKEYTEVKEAYGELKERARTRESEQKHKLEIVEMTLAKKDRELTELAKVRGNQAAS